MLREMCRERLNSKLPDVRRAAPATEKRMEQAPKQTLATQELAANTTAAREAEPTAASSKT